jgi:hypothetical protein
MNAYILDGFNDDGDLEMEWIVDVIEKHRPLLGNGLKGELLVRPHTPV